MASPDDVQRVPNAMVKSSGRAAGRALCALITIVLAVASSNCNLRPISKSLTRYGYMGPSGDVSIPVKFENGRGFSEGWQQ